MRETVGWKRGVSLEGARVAAPTGGAAFLRALVRGTNKDLSRMWGQGSRSTRASQITSCAGHDKEKGVDTPSRTEGADKRMHPQYLASRLPASLGCCFSRSVKGEGKNTMCLRGNYRQLGLALLGQNRSPQI